MFGKKKTNIPIIPYNPETYRAILKCSICSGEQVAGFKDKLTGKFTEVCLIRASDSRRESYWRHNGSQGRRIYYEIIKFI